jgi:hypothetical protein
MGKNRDVIQILLIVIIGMFIPFLGSIVITFGLDLSDFDNILKIGSTFGYFLLIFGIELIIVYLYYTVSNKIAGKKLEKLKHK